MAAAARIEVQLIGDKRAEQGLQRVTGATQRLQGAQVKGTTASKAAALSASDLTRRMNEQKNQAVLLSQQLGVSLPTAAQNALVANQALGRAISAAFNVGLVIFFADALVRVGTKIGNLILKWRGFNDELRSTVARVAALNKALLGERPVEQLENELRIFRKEFQEAERVLGTADPFSVQAQALAVMDEKAALARERLIQLKKIIPDLEDQIIKLRNKGTDKLADSVERLASLPPIELLPAEVLESLTRGNALMTRLAEEQEKLNLLRKSAPKLLEQIQDQNAQLVISTLQGEERVRAELEEKLRSLEKIKNTYMDFRGVVDAVTHQEKLLTEQSQRRIAEIRQQNLEKMAQQFQVFFQQVFLTARSFNDVWKQLQQQMVRVFVTSVSKMVAAWIVGQRQMQAATLGGRIGAGGGPLEVLSSILFGGTGFGGFGTRTAPGGTGTFTGAPIGGEFGPAASAGLGVPTLSRREVTTTVGFPPPAPGSATGIAAQQKLLAQLGINLQQLIGFGLLSAGLFGLQKAAQGSVLGGALGGFALGGPIGALLGGLFGASRRGKLKRRAAAAEDAFSRQLIEVVDEFKAFQLDFQAALDTIDQLFAEFAIVVQPFGFAGRRAVRNIGPFVGAVKDRIREIQAAREARAALSIFSAIPEFAHGGLVPSLLHPGEFVIRREAVEKVGTQNLERLNRGERGLGNVNISFARGAIVIQQGVGGDAYQLARTLRRPLIREIERELRNRGLHLGS